MERSRSPPPFKRAIPKRQLTAIERFTRSADGNRLELEVAFRDPVNLSKPLVMARAWAWAPGEEIYPYESCVIPE